MPHPHTSIPPREIEVGYPLLVEANVPTHLYTSMGLALLQLLVIVSFKLDQRPKDVLILVGILIPRGRRGYRWRRGGRGVEERGEMEERGGRRKERGGREMDGGRSGGGEGVRESGREGGGEWRRDGKKRDREE